MYGCFYDCTDAPGCETDSSSDALNCGSCGYNCSIPLVHATAECVESQCSIFACDDGYINCEDGDLDGCQIHSAVDIFNCGGCGNDCTNNENYVTVNNVLCINGFCDYDNCTDGNLDCDGDRTTFCETPMDATNCGCGVDCSILQPNSNPFCNLTVGNCTVDAGCNSASWGDCTNAPGCETDLDSDPLNCGQCGYNCSKWVLHSDPDCQSGYCYLDICDVGFDNCDDDGGNGCETDLNSIYSCGICGNDCTSADYFDSAINVTCSNGACNYSICAAGYLDCDGFRDTYCEVPMDETNCGSCDNQCQLPNTDPFCDLTIGGGTCTTDSGDKCQEEYADCNDLYSDGCEIQTSSDPLNCGACGSPCDDLSSPNCMFSECMGD